MKDPILILCLSLFATICSAQQESEISKVEYACFSYIDGFYQGDKSKLKTVLQPTLHKFGFWKNKESGSYGEPIAMSYDAALAYADDVLAKKQFAKTNAPRKVIVLDVLDKIASAKITAWWGIDYILLSKEDDRWMIEQVLWQGPLNARK